MTQEVFWKYSTINFGVVAAIGIINIIISVIMSVKLRKLNKKMGIDLTMHKELMNSVSEFLVSIGFEKVNFLSNYLSDPQFQTDIHTNYSNMKNKYIKLVLNLGYSYTDSKYFLSALEKVYIKYNKVFEHLLSGVYAQQHYDELINKDPLKASDGLLEKSAKELQLYREILDDTKVDEYFWENMNSFIEREIDYMKKN